MASILPKGLTLRALETFVTLARTGSIAATAAELGLSAPAVSQQIKNLATALGVEIVDHSRRPMILTPAGRVFLPKAETALAALQHARRDLTALDLSGLSTLSLGVIEDFENEVTPTLVGRLAKAMSHCAFTLQTGASHSLLARIAQRELDIAICAEDHPLPPGVVVHRLLRDPYILALPKGRAAPATLRDLGDLTFVRRDADQIMGRQIEEFLERTGLSLPNRFEMDSNQSISALVASGEGWTITTPLSLLRAGRFSPGIDAHPISNTDFARTISLYATNDWSGDIPAQIASVARDLIADHFVVEGQKQMPWLADSFRALNEIRP